MQTAKIFKNGRSQAVRLPKEFQFSDEEVIIQRHGDAVILVPRDKRWKTFRDSLDSFSDDFMADGREQGEQTPREPLS